MLLVAKFAIMPFKDVIITDIGLITPFNEILGGKMV
ncbi:hypothetical protein SAMN05216405_4317 [Lachnospiraceae bacterium NLAE-zl-G231]|nr:hypothetical protein SAMN05216405_4317 [Lachnospiraceae bacterium NLAE-zl-G231]